ncbi:MAG: zinc ABC transporter ATP-binding protein ZnuC [bacterium]
MSVIAPTRLEAAEGLLQLKNISVYHDQKAVIENINLTLHRGEIVTVIGPNGAGKSTLIKTALGIIHPDQGKVERSGSLRVGYVPQSVSLDSTLPLTVSRFLRLSSRSNAGDLDQAMDQVGANGLLHNSMHTLSGGELRRILLVRALLKKPDILILDEPTAGVDISGQAALYHLIQQIRDQYQCGVLLVSHDLHIVMAATDRVFCLNRHLCCSGAPEQVQEHPEYLAIFGQQNAHEIGIYRHQHDHDHNLHGDVCDHG